MHLLLVARTLARYAAITFLGLFAFGLLANESYYAIAPAVGLLVLIERKNSKNIHPYQPAAVALVSAIIGWYGYALLPSKPEGGFETVSKVETKAVTKERKTSPKKETGEVAVQMSDSDYAEACFLASEASVSNPGTFDRSWTNTTVYRVPSSDRVVAQVGFSAKNGVGMKSDFTAKCYYDGAVFDSGPEIVQR